MCLDWTSRINVVRLHGRLNQNVSGFSRKVKHFSINRRKRNTNISGSSFGNTCDVYLLTVVFEKSLKTGNRLGEEPVLTHGESINSNGYRLAANWDASRRL